VLIEEVAKYRAARRLWAHIMKERFGAKDPKSWQLRFHAQTAGSSLQAQQPLVNVVRTTVQALAATLGGAQSLHTNAFDEALALPTETSARLALRTQQVLAHESGIGDIVDPLGGAYAVESLTTEIEARATDYIKRIDEMGGMVAAIEQAWPQREIEQRAYEYQRAIEKHEKIIVGVNEFQLQEPAPTDLLKIDPGLEREQATRVEALRKGRDGQKAAEALRALTAAAQGSDNLLPRIVDCVKSSVTVGEISDALRAQFGEHREGRH
jgi:methylmalonyl-CoA mutase N-terminal domain/subunit